MTSDETLPEPSGPGSVVLDIGGDVGAAVVTTSAQLACREIEIRRVGESWEGRHVAVLERRLAAGSVWAAVFGSLAEGDWQVRVRDCPSSPVVSFTVEGSRVTTTQLNFAQLPLGSMPAGRLPLTGRASSGWPPGALCVKHA